MKRFWTAVTVTQEGAGHGIALDGRPVRTPGRTPLVVPTAALAAAITGEWRAVTDDIDPRAMPLTGLANAAIDRIGPDPQAFATGLARYGESDLLCYRTVEPAPLVARQAAAWDPVIGWARGRFDIHLEVASGVMHVAQPPATLARLADAVAARNAFELAGLSPVVTVTGSLLLALALIEGAADADTIWAAARIDDDWQEEMWGRDDLAAQATAAHRADFDAGARFLSLLA
ncbi:Chaperone required for the assembly of the F1-ATPase [Sphingomonas guangdongensis]|uniref:Chaperone required for the assembly of the F1-ATPase n=1 Tax=Sphingomonas guangdongensis TaxID=1141890 RepID=A0A285QAR9_9SPHN|nr:ATP12 family protein [Sphingomonas guangdongensis]SOB79020.1 Chaperone required for the assembly of the F1-ATPase [Sphingomonas guangdongensis]